MDKKGKGFSPHWVAGAIGRLKWEKKDVCVFVCESRCNAVNIYICTWRYRLTLLSLVVSWTEICTKGLGSLLPFFIYTQTLQKLFTQPIQQKRHNIRARAASKLKAGLTGRSWPWSRYTVKMAAEGGSALLPNVVMFWFFWRTCGIKQGFNKPILYLEEVQFVTNLKQASDTRLDRSDVWILTSVRRSAEGSRESHSSFRWTFPLGVSLRVNHWNQRVWRYQTEPFRIRVGEWREKNDGLNHCEEKVSHAFTVKLRKAEKKNNVDAKLCRLAGK